MSNKDDKPLWGDFSPEEKCTILNNLAAGVNSWENFYKAAPQRVSKAKLEEAIKDFRAFEVFVRSAWPMQE